MLSEAARRTSILGLRSLTLQANYSAKWMANPDIMRASGSALFLTNGAPAALRDHARNFRLLYGQR
jgi:hypothetical protein